MKEVKEVKREDAIQMVVVVPKELHEILSLEAQERGRSLVDISRTILSQWAKKYRKYQPIKILDGRTKAAREQKSNS